MKTSTIVWSIVVLVVLLLGAWWLTSMQAPAAPAENPQGAQPAEQQAAADPALYVSGNLLLGADGTSKHLIAYNGMTLYTFDKDTAGGSACTDACAANWPPYIVASADALANVQAGVTGKVTTIMRADGSMQVAYDGKPLYFWIQDKQSGDMTGDGVNGFAVAKP